MIALIALLLTMPADVARNHPAPTSTPVYEPAPADLVTVGDWPPIGKWMISKHMRPAAWLGAKMQGKALREPINIVIVDAAAGSAEEAVTRLEKACAAAGYKIREGHSAGYRGYLGGVLFHQLPVKAGHAFSNEPFELHNNHGRIFGPFPTKDGWMFIGALSRERFDPLTRTEHVYVSFNQARDHFARKLDEVTGYKITRRVDLGNALADDPAACTGDHDGKAVVLRAER